MNDDTLLASVLRRFLDPDTPSQPFGWSQTSPVGENRCLELGFDGWVELTPDEAAAVQRVIDAQDAA